MTDIYLDGPPPAAQRVNELHAWIATHAGGGEGIISADVSFPFGKRHLALITSNRRSAEALEVIAERAALLAQENGVNILSIELVTFRKVT